MALIIVSPDGSFLTSEKSRNIFHSTCTLPWNMANANDNGIKNLNLIKKIAQVTSGKQGEQISGLFFYFFSLLLLKALLSSQIASLDTNTLSIFVKSVQERKKRDAADM